MSAPSDRTADSRQAIFRATVGPSGEMHLPNFISDAKLLELNRICADGQGLKRHGLVTCALLQECAFVGLSDEEKAEVLKAMAPRINAMKASQVFFDTRQAYIDLRLRMNKGVKPEEKFVSDICGQWRLGEERY